MIIPVHPDRWDYNKTIQDIGHWLYQNGYQNYINYNDIVSIDVNNERYFPVMDFKNNQCILQKEL